MIRKLTLAAGFGAGYVLGARAGRQRYDQIVAKAREFAGRPEVQDATHNLQQTASQLGDKAKATVNETVAAVGDKVGEKVGGGHPDVVDLSTGTSRPTAAPMPGAAASPTAPETAR
ncbi:MAG: hypothetical protein JWN35_1651 [Frankiales bacterium]|nr:hypothetical protein [Frankiales bacterium]